MADLGVLAKGVGQVLSRTILLQTNTSTGIPQPLAVLDVVDNETPEFNADVSENPVEKGPEVTDHIQLKNPVLRLRGKISSTPIDMGVSVANVLSGGLSAFTDSQFRSNLLNSGISQGVGIIGASLQGTASDPANAAGGLDAISRSILLTAYENKTPFDVITKRQRYKDMVIRRLSFPRNAETGAALNFEMELVQVKIVSPLKVQKDSVNESVINGAVPTASIGAQSTQTASTQMRSSIINSNLGSAPGMASKFAFLG